MGFFGIQDQRNFKTGTSWVSYYYFWSYRKKLLLGI